MGSKLPHIGTSIFTQMTQLANQHGAINLSQGFPNFAIDQRLSDIVAKKVYENVHQYQPASGNPMLLQKIAALLQTSYRRDVNPGTELLVTAGATQGIFTAIQALVSHGEEVVLLDPCYDSYETPILLAGGKPVHVRMRPDYSPDWPAINNAVSSATRLIVINTPHNPSGRVWTESDFVALEQLLDQHPNLLVLSDEVYEYIAFEQPHVSVHHRAKLRDRSLSVSSFGKSFHITGWKVGYMVAPEPIMAEIKKVHQFLVFSVNSVAQSALAVYLDVVDVGALRAFYRQKRDDFAAMLSATNLKLLPCEGTYFQLASFGHLSQESDVDFAQRLVVEYGVAAIPVSRFHTDGTDQRHIRFCFAKDNETLMAAAERLKKL
ncbi:methionine aminotransferase [Flavobacterium caeni]|uniref:methionine aminotransferase n=1 Tax=Flavobacterium caeni TaxID=490189 RepID=UPI000B8613CB|nr:methionine aminotransferase [Flavobacterium caeni]